MQTFAKQVTYIRCLLMPDLRWRVDIQLGASQHLQQRILHACYRP